MINPGDNFKAIGIDQTIRVIDVLIAGNKIELVVEIIRNGFMGTHKVFEYLVEEYLLNEELYTKLN